MIKNPNRKRPEKVFVVPANGLLVRTRREDGGHLMNPKGESVPWDKYWQRRVLEGTVTREKQEQPAANKPAKRARAGEGASES